MQRVFLWFLLFLAVVGFTTGPVAQESSTTSQKSWLEGVEAIDNGTIRIGVDRAKGGAITWLSWASYPKSAVNIADPGRLIQQSYYAGKALDRTSEGQSSAWSPWPWNPIQGGGVSSWARLIECRTLDSNTLYSATVPKLWDMPNEEAKALMKQWTSFEPGMSNVVRIRCEFVSQREPDDRWGPPVSCSQEIPACYFTRAFGRAKSYLGGGKWRSESQPLGPPWGQANPPRKAIACFNAQGQGIAVFSPVATRNWNFGPHGHGESEDPAASPCMHVAPLDNVALGPKSEYRYRYWLAVGSEDQLSACLDVLCDKYAGEKANFVP